MQNRSKTSLCAFIERKPMNTSEEYLSIFRASNTEF